MITRSLIWGAFATAAALSPAFAQDSTVRIVLNEEVDLLEPCMTTRSNIGRVTLQNVNETLAFLDLREGGGLQPKLAESWEQLDDGSWRFHLRQGVTFSDGTTFDANDVKHSFDRAMDPSITCEVPRYFGGMTVSAEVVDEHTIDFSADPEQPILPLLLTLIAIVPEETPIEFVRDPIGTGPYALSEWTPGQRIVLSQRDDYWGEQPAVTEATYLFRADPAVRAAMVATGEADISPSIAALDATNPETDFSYLDSETVYGRLDHSVTPFDDLRVRKALNLAIDREAFIGTLVPEGALLASAVYPPPTLGWNESVEVWPYDPEEAARLLQEAAADGVATDTPITLVGRTANFPNNVEILEAVQQMLQEAGFTVELQFYEVAEFEELYSKPYPEGRGPMIVVAMHDNSRADPSFSMYFKYASDGRQSGIDDPKADDLINRAQAATGEEREALWKELHAYLHDEVVADLLLFHMVGFSRVNERLDWQPTMATNSQLPLADIAFR
ncbi:peptide/nickel transport system substrate-binding protein [Paracoccus alcaliphilus]|uniref:Peptide/nickel transport system substrate-binding protein n=1 Tax=Paracoccus alcaliphilus TaxID=34002 RepID=A0A1H8HFS1_9RHOB|nr:ABC transporter substrate-binding protein [Paracoccus alcaliphilus]WCR20679.1 peptide ABC transporter substrate-binding protein [Paracoccus alcaliphilus]SEN54398.1 peptide/nickel transport system substrate-binding protein [Paracoccus alcaliphilus]